jgi:hypothetical protein
VSIPSPGFLNHYPHNNDDLTVVNAARVSMGKRVDKIVLAGTPEAEKRKAETGMHPDDSLINYLAEKRHWTPFGQVRFAFRCSFKPTEFVKWAGDEDASAGFTWSNGRHYNEDGKLLTFDIEGSLWGWLRNPPPSRTG